MYYKVCPFCGEVLHAYIDNEEWKCLKCLNNITNEEVGVMALW